ncbi:clr5 domain protein [Apiospora arundinis]
MTRRPIQQYPAETWETHKAHLYHLYIQQGKSLKQIQHIMAQRGFNASDKMYKDRFSKWGFRKNRRALTREKLETPGGNSTSSSISSTLHAHNRAGSGNGSGSSGSSIRADGMMHTQYCYASILGPTTTMTTRDYRPPPPHGGLPLAYFHGALYDNRPRLPDTYLVQDQLLRCFDGMVARAWAAGELKPGDTNKIMYVTPEVHRKLVHLFDVNDYASTLADGTLHCHPSAMMRKGYESVSNFLKKPSMLGFLRLLQLTIYTGRHSQLPVVWHHIANSRQLRHCSVPGLYELCQNMDKLFGFHPPTGTAACSPFVDLVTNLLPRLEAMVPPPPPPPPPPPTTGRETAITTPSPAADDTPWTPLRQLREMLRRLLLATSHRHSLSETLKRYACNSELLVRELLEQHERQLIEQGYHEGSPGRLGRWHICEDISAALPKEIRLDLAIFSAFKRADEYGNCNVHQGFWKLEKERQRQEEISRSRGDDVPMLLTENTAPPAPPLPPSCIINNTTTTTAARTTTTTTTTMAAANYYHDNSNARLGLAISLRRKAMEYITGTEQREHGERFEDLKVLETWYRDMGDTSSADEAVRQSERELALHLATLTI